jgi:hypothetical protein
MRMLRRLSQQPTQPSRSSHPRAIVLRISLAEAAASCWLMAQGKEGYELLPNGMANCALRAEKVVTLHPSSVWRPNLQGQATEDSQELVAANPPPSTSTDLSFSAQQSPEDRHEDDSGAVRPRKLCHGPWCCAQNETEGVLSDVAQRLDGPRLWISGVISSCVSSGCCHI